MRRRRWVAAGAVGAAVLAIALTLGLTGGGDRDGGSPAGFATPSVAEAADATIRAGGAKVAAATILTPKDGSPEAKIVGRGYVDGSGERMVMDAKISGVPGQGDARFGGIDVHYIYEDPVLYMRLPEVVGRIERGKTWMKLDYGRLLEGAGVDMALFEAENASPAQKLRFLRATSDKVRKLGVEEVDGVPTMHYVGNVDVRRYPKLVPPAERKAARQAAQRFTELTGDPVDPVDVWIGEDGLVRRIKTHWDDEANGVPVTRTEIVEFLEFGQHFRYERPPPGEVVDMTDRALEQADG